VPGGYDGVLRGVAGGLVREIPFHVAIVAASGPVLDAIVPEAIAGGAVGQTVQLRGRRFAAGAVVTSDSPAVTVANVRVVTPELAVVTLDSRRDAAGREVHLRLVNPGGQATPDARRLRLLAPSSLEAPLAVTGTAILLPRPGTQIGAGEQVFAHGLLATSGSGTVIGSWALDGVPFDRFTVRAVAGQPLAVASRVAIPQLARGNHGLSLVIDHPQRLASPPVAVVETVGSASQVQLLAPGEGAALRGRPLTLRWTLVAGAAAYEVEVETAGGTSTLHTRVSAPLWRLSDEERLSLGDGAWRWRVRPVLPGEVRAEPTHWRALTLLPEVVRITVEPGAREAGGVMVRWRPGAPGLGYRVVLLAASGEERRSALVGEPSYLLPREGPQPQAGDSLKVEAYDADGERAGESELVPVALPGAGEEPVAPVPDPQRDHGTEPRLFGGGFNVEATGSRSGGDEPTAPDAAGLALSSQATRAAPAAEGAATADVSWHRELDSDGAPTERLASWITRAAGGRGGGRGEVRAGVATPSFLDGLELLAGGLARTGAEVQVSARAGLRAAYYSTFESSAIGIPSAGSLAPGDELRAAAFEVGGENRRFLLRAVTLEVDSPATPLSLGGAGRTYGLFGRIGSAAGLHLLLEAARGELEPAPGNLVERSEGSALRLGLERSGPRLTWQLALRHVEAGYANAADRGVLAGGLAGRDSVELSGTATFGRSSLALALQAIDGDAGAGTPARVRTANASLNAPLGTRFQLGLTGNATTTRADADLAAFALEVERLDWGLGGVLTATLGAFQLSQSLSLAEHDDRLEPLLDTTTTSFATSLAGSLAGAGALSLSIAGGRAEAAPSLGRTDSLTASLQPSWEIRRAAIRLQPYYSYNRTRNRALGLDATSEQIHGGFAWSPPWLRSLVTLDLAGDWIRQRSGDGTADEGFTARYTANLVVRFGRRVDPTAAGGDAVTPAATTAGEILPSSAWVPARRVNR
jgi:hypothetical protein